MAVEPTAAEPRHVTSPAADPAPPPSPRTLMAVYIGGMFAMGYIDIFVFLMPLYGGELHFSATEIGMLVGMRSLLPVFLSIHIGTLMDRFGTRRVTMVFVLAAMGCGPLFPLLPWFPALFMLQAINGCAVSFCWAGAQTLAAQVGHGEAEYLGRFSFAGRVGTTVAPVVAGAVWDWGGLWPAYLFGTVWGAMLLLALWRTPEQTLFHSDGHAGAAPPQAAAPESFRPRDLMPRWADYAASFALLAIPAVAMSIAIIFVRNATSGVQNSLYVVYLEHIGYSATIIGVLFAAVEIASGFGSLLGGRAMRLGRPQTTLIAGTILAIALIAATPLLGGLAGPPLLVLALLFAAQLWRGALQGVIQPVMFSVQAKAVGRHQQGSVVGLRQTMTRIAAIVVPPLMGGIADIWGLAESFYILGGLLMLLCLPLAWLARRVERAAASSVTHV